MLYEKIKFDEQDDSAFLEIYISDKVCDFVRNAILVIPGGGYAEVCSEREGEQIAMAFIPHGYNAFVLHYIEQMAEEMSRNSTEDYNSKICDPVEFDRVT